MMKKILTLMMSTALLFGTQSTVFADTGNYAEGDVHTIGVILYDPDSAEMEMFADYYRDYIEEGFPVKFIFSGKVADSEAEKAFITEANFLCRICRRASGCDQNLRERGNLLRTWFQYRKR